EECIAANIEVAKLTNPKVMMVGVAINTAALCEQDAQHCLDETAQRLGLPTVDPFRNGVESLVQALD
ncbi:MAG: NAD-dependent epimerase/dehydratase family protein, partial [Gammaproteobacteria bacterium]|nr:NAD-dependent epimerase/dehydratase family protein [Gammaproteobacteria bacterium]